jgi:hypothetical protein
MIISNDQDWIIHTLSNQDYFNLYGLNNQIVAKIACLFNTPVSTSTNTLFQHQKLIQAIGDEYKAYQNNTTANSTTRVNTAYTLSSNI